MEAAASEANKSHAQSLTQSLSADAPYQAPAPEAVLGIAPCAFQVNDVIFGYRVVKNGDLPETGEDAAAEEEDFGCGMDFAIDEEILELKHADGV